MKCPKCSAGMESVTFQDVQVDRCTKCQGIFFDAREHIALKDIKGSEAIDTGDAATGRKMDKKANVTCPRCSTKMVQVADVDQHHIVLDACPSCLGVFFDAGEFRDFKVYSFADYLKGLFRHNPGK
ncbi:MAG: zf-TFIIB domain-containing protein [Planctomycetes bacterium]|nr:zf-TFIIB domain-containing protein [Planctomycetota bacterium]